MIKEFLEEIKKLQKAHEILEEIWVRNEDLLDDDIRHSLMDYFGVDDNE